MFAVFMTESVHTARYRRLRELLIEARTSRDLSQTALAEKLGRVQTFVSKYERGERRLDLIEFLEVTRVLGVDPHQVMRRVESIAD